MIKESKGRWLAVAGGGVGVGAVWGQRGADPGRSQRSQRRRKPRTGFWLKGFCAGCGVLTSPTVPPPHTHTQASTRAQPLSRAAARHPRATASERRPHAHPRAGSCSSHQHHQHHQHHQQASGHVTSPGCGPQPPPHAPCTPRDAASRWSSPCSSSSRHPQQGGGRHVQRAGAVRRAAGAAHDAALGPGARAVPPLCFCRALQPPADGHRAGAPLGGGGAQLCAGRAPAQLLRRQRRQHALTLCQYEALKHVGFVAQTLAKTAKALPVVLWGTLVAGKRFSARQFGHSLLLTGGCSAFVLAGGATVGSATRDDGAAAHAAGGLLLVGFLAADGWTSTQQEALFRRHATPVREQLLFTTAFSAAFSLALSVASGQLRPAAAFLCRHPDAALAVLALSLASTVIQVCISTVLQRHGALALALMLTTRQCLSVLLSTLLFGHRLSLTQWVGIAVVFTALFHQRSGIGAKQGGHQHQRSRQAAVATGERMPHTRQSCAGAALKDRGQPDSKQQQQAHSSVAFWGLPGRGGPLATMREGVAAAPPAASLSPPPASPVVYAGRPSDPNCVGVADVHPRQHVVHRAVAPAAATDAGSQPAPAQHMPASAPPAAAATAGGGAAAAKKQQRLDLATLWSRGAGRVVRIETATAVVASEHRE